MYAEACTSVQRISNNMVVAKRGLTNWGMACVEKFTGINTFKLEISDIIGRY